MSAPKKFEHWGALPVYSRRAMVATADRRATEAGVAVLREGGNVIDAAVAAAFALCVTQPGMCGLGGGGHLVAHVNGQSLCLDFREQAPAAAHRDLFAGMPAEASRIGPWAAATPGTVKGLAEAHRRAGSLPWARLLAPAVALAAEGHAVTWLRSRMLAACAALYRDPESHRILLRGGRPFEAGEILRQPELAATLERIARHGAAEFYEGETAEKLAAGGGLIRKSDLASYTCAECRPLTGVYRGSEIRTMPPSSAGGRALLEMLAALEGTPFAEDGPASALFLHSVAEAAKKSFARRAGRGLAESACTTHLSVLDCEGNAAALTFTLNGMYGCGVTVPGLGFLLNNNMDNFAVRPGEPNQYGLVEGEDNAIGPGKRPVSSMTPTLVCREGRPEAVLGTPGGPTIPTAVLQALLYMLEFGWNPQDAVNAPRVHHQWLPDVLYLERGFPAEVTRALESRGHRLEYRASNNDMNAIVWRDGWLQGAVDCRREGHAAGI
ncbi:MAG: gamma-glutamyltransferase family protein [Bryobacteraceae bacterium]